jgi:hypothetical protein
VRTLRVSTVPCRSPLADRANVVNVRDPPVRTEPTHTSWPHRNPNKIYASPSPSPAPTIANAERPTAPLTLLVVLDRLPSAVLRPGSSPLSFFVPFPYIISHNPTIVYNMNQCFHRPCTPDSCIVPSPSGSPRPILIRPIYALI